MTTTAFLLDQDSNYYVKLGEAIGGMIDLPLPQLPECLIMEIS